jgi:hypothetical protein
MTYKLKAKQRKVDNSNRPRIEPLLQVVPDRLNDSLRHFGKPLQVDVDMQV